jgi:hypothetical protein
VLGPGIGTRDITPGNAGGKISGSNIITSAPGFAFAAIMASRRLPGGTGETPSAVVVTIICAPDDVPAKISKQKMSAKWKRHCAGCARLRNLFMVRFLFVVLMLVYPHTVIGAIGVLSNQSYETGRYGPRIERWFR